MKVANFFREFCSDNHLSEDLTYGVFSFELTQEKSLELLRYVIQGKKRATSSLKEEFLKNGEPLPKKNDLYVITDLEGEPYVIVMNRAVHELKFRNMDFTLARLEGEDENLESWRRKHLEFFNSLAEKYGYDFNEDSIIIFEIFEVVYVRKDIRP